MGVDKSNIRTVIHRAAPATVESYLQESGRGGRDGEAARAVLLVEEPVRVGWTWWTRARRPHRHDTSGVDSDCAAESGPSTPPGAATNARPPALHGYIHTAGCRRRYLLEAMGAQGECTGCDRCDRAADPCAEEARLVERVLRRPFRMDVDRLPARLAIAALDHGFTAPPWQRKDLAEVVKARHPAR
jgi:ATP-dependent DNA helicase RecQ